MTSKVSSLLLAALGSLVTLLASPTTLLAGTSISACGPITQSGTYTLSQDISSNSGDCIDIQVSNVTLRLNGHKITGPGAPTAINGVLVLSPSGLSLSNVFIIGNGMISGCGFGVQLVSAINSGVIGVSLFTNAVGVSVGGTASNPSKHLFISQNDVEKNNLDGIDLNQTSLSRVIGNNCSNNTRGISLTASTGNVLLGNLCNSGGFTGIVLDSGSTGNNLEGNTTNSNFANGIDLHGGSNTLVGNGADTNGADGILVEAGSTGSHFSGNVALGNSTFEAEDDNSNCGTNVYHNDAFGTTNQSCVNTLLAGTPISACGTTITKSGTYTLTQDLSSSSGDCIDIQVSDVTLKLNGHNISGGGGSNGVSVQSLTGLSLNNVFVIGKGTISGFFIGIQLFSGISRSGVIGVALSGNSVGISVGGTSNNPSTNLLISQNDVEKSSGGLFLSGTSLSRIVGNNCSNNENGITLLGSTGNVLLGNTCNSGFEGIFLPANSTGNHLEGNTTNFNGGFGIDLAGGSNTLVGNGADTNGTDGILVEVLSTGNRFTGNAALGNSTFDVQDNNSNCGTNLYKNDVFINASQPCVK